MRLAIILVHYHTAELLLGAIESLRAELASSGLEAELIVVDNGSTEAERTLLSGLPAKWIDAGANLGYAGGVNLGVHSTDADAFIVMNCDIEVLPGCVGTLLRALSTGYAVAGPQFYWDRTQSVLLPPPELRDFKNELIRQLSSRCGGYWTALARMQWRRHAWRHWTAKSLLPSFSLSGSLLAISRFAWEEIGPFDESYSLYFEETDWLMRAQKKGLSACYEPSASAIHFHNQSGVNEPSTRKWYAESAKLFAKRHYGWCAQQIFERLPVSQLPKAVPSTPLSGGLSALNETILEIITPSCQWIEISPVSTGFPAAGAFVAGRQWTLPEGLWRYMTPGSYSLRLLDAQGSDQGQLNFEVPERIPTFEIGGRPVAYAP